MQKPKKVLTSKVVYKNSYYQIRKDLYESKKGKKKPYYTMTTVPFVVIIAYDRKKKLIYLVKNWRYPIKKYHWELPAGRVDKNETPLMAAKRELLEETGIKAKKWKSLGSFYILPGTTNRRGYVYVAERIELVRNAIIDDEIAQVKSVSLTIFKKMVKQSKFKGAPCIIGSQKFLDYLKQT